MASHAQSFALRAHESPLKQQARPTRSLFASRIGELFALPTDGTLPIDKLNDLFVLPIDLALATALQTATVQELLARPACRLLFRTCLQRLRNGEDATEILFILLREVLAKTWSNPTIDVLVLLTGSLDRGDAEFAAFVTILDERLCNLETTPSLRERILSVALLFVAGTGQGSSNAFFLRRDLFRPLAQIVCHDPHSRAASLASILIALLANHRRLEARNTMMIRLEDLVDESVMQALSASASLALLRARNAYVGAISNAQPTLISAITTFFPSVHLGEIFQHKAAFSLLDAESALKALPPCHVNALVPIYTLAVNNQAFLSLLFSDMTGAGSSFLAGWASFCSYLFSHAACASARARIYCRLCIFLMDRLLDEDISCLLPDVRVQLCRQRQPSLPACNDEERPFLGSMLDCILLFLRHNLRRKLDIDCYISALRLLHKIMHSLKSASVRLSYEWLPMWQALLTLCAFVVKRRDELASFANIARLQDLIIVCIDFACVHGEVSFLQDAEAGADLLFEVMRCAMHLRALCLLGSPTVNQSVINLETLMGSLSAVLAMPPAKTPSQGLSQDRDQSLDYASKQPIMQSAAEVIVVIKMHAGALVLEESMALEDVRPFEESPHASFFQEMARVCAADATEIVLMEQEK